MWLKPLQGGRGPVPGVQVERDHVWLCRGHVWLCRGSAPCPQPLSLFRGSVSFSPPRKQRPRAAGSEAQGQGCCSALCGDRGARLSPGAA